MKNDQCKMKCSMLDVQWNMNPTLPRPIQIAHLRCASGGYQSAVNYIFLPWTGYIL
jgi:hypothetical protein